MAFRLRSRRRAPQRYGGRLIFSETDAFGPVEVVETADSRRLHLGSPVQQTRMLLHDPGHLAFAYFRAMALALLLRPGPERVLILGLGGGSLARWLARSEPGAEVEAVELRPLVARVAGEFFALEAGPRLAVHVGDARDFLRRAPPGHYDLVFSDLYDGRGMAASTLTHAHFDACRDCLAPGGILCSNLWREDLALFGHATDLMDTAFDRQTLFLSLRETANTIAFARVPGAPPPGFATLRQRAERDTERLGIDLRRQLRRLKSQNPGRLSGA